MSEFSKVIIGFVLLIVLCVGCFCGGYLLSNSRAAERIEQSNNELAAQQQKYDTAIRAAEERIRETEQRISDIREQLSKQVFDNGKATEELSELVETIRKQKLNV